MSRWLTVALVLLSTPALAGDPCPISFDMAEYTPQWRDRAEDLGALTSKRTWIGLNYGGQSTAGAVTAVVAPTGGCPYSSPPPGGRRK